MRIASRVDTIDTIVTRSLLAALGLALVACNGLLDIHDLPIAPTDTSPDASTDGSMDGSTDAIDASGDEAAETCGAPDDRHNCGVCGHDCLGGDCLGGACQPVVVSPPHEDVRALAIDADPNGSLWFANWNPGQAYRLDKSTHTETQLYWAATDFFLTALRVDATHAYWIATRNGAASGADVVFRADEIDGANRTTLPATFPWAVDLAVGKSALYVLNRTGSDAVVRVALDLSASSGIVPSTGAQENAIAVDGAEIVYFAGTDGVGSVHGDGSGLTHVFASAATSIVVDDTRVWFASGDTIYAVPTGGSCDPGSCPTRLVRGQVDASTTAIAADDTAVYWSFRDQLLRARKDQPGVPVVDTLSSGHAVNAIAVDTRAIYFTSAGSVWMIAK